MRGDTGGRKIERKRWMMKRIGDWKGNMGEERKKIREGRGEDQGAGKC